MTTTVRCELQVVRFVPRRICILSCSEKFLLRPIRSCPFFSLERDKFVLREMAVHGEKKIQLQLTFDIAALKPA